MCHYLGGGLHGRQKRVKAQSESSKSVVNSVLISREMPVFPGFFEIIRVVIVTDKNKSSLKVMYARNIWGNDKNIVRLEEECDKGGKPYQWILEFKDRIIVIENGELVDEKIR